MGFELLEMNDDLYGLLNEVIRERDELIAEVQLTGLYDCDGHEIYEGDVVTLGDDPTPSVVRWDDKCACFIIVKSLILGNVHKHVRVIGNVHDNPELLERKP